MSQAGQIVPSANNQFKSMKYVKNLRFIKNVNFLLVYLHPLKRSFLLKFIEDAIKATLLVSMLHKLLASIT